ncbi:MAG: NAD(+)/NADH kinase [Actinomycetota bacterium]
MEGSVSVGLVANPASARDIRRLVAHGGSLTTHDKLNRLQRVLAGLAAAGVTGVVSMADRAGIMGGLLGLASRPAAARWPALTFVDQPVTQTEQDAAVATRAMVDAGVGAIVVLGGDGTNRVVATESGTTPLVSISTGTNNAFPRPVESTVAGLAAGLVATNHRCRAVGTYRAKRLLVTCGDRTDLAIVDVAIGRGDGVGSGAVWDAASIAELFLCFAEPDAIGLSAIGGQVRPTDRREAEGLALRLGHPAASTVHAAIGPGLVSPVGIQATTEMMPGVAVPVHAEQGVIAVDGERRHRFGPDDRPTVTLDPAGPVVVDVPAVMAHAAAQGLLSSPASGPCIGGRDPTGVRDPTSNPSETDNASNQTEGEAAT